MGKGINKCGCCTKSKNLDDNEITGKNLRKSLGIYCSDDRKIDSIDENRSFTDHY